MPPYQPGDYVKFEAKNESTGDSEWMWLKVDSSDDEHRIVFGHLDSEPLVNPDLQLGSQLAVSYDNMGSDNHPYGELR